MLPGSGMAFEALELVTAGCRSLVTSHYAGVNEAHLAGAAERPSPDRNRAPITTRTGTAAMAGSLHSCEHCGVGLERRLQCSRCKQAVYCCKEHQVSLGASEKRASRRAGRLTCSAKCDSL